MARDEQHKDRMPKGRISMAISEEDHRSLKQAAQTLGLSVSQLVADLIPSPAACQLLRFCKDGGVFGESRLGDIQESLTAWGIVDSPRLSKLVQLCVRDMTQRSILKKPDTTKRPTVTLQAMLNNLRSENESIRTEAGLILSASIGNGLRISQEDRLDCEHTIGADLSRLIGAAMATGDSDSVNELERILSNQPPAESPADAKDSEVPA